MKIPVNKTAWQATGLVFGSFVLLVAFQNCGKAGFDAALDETVDLPSSDAALTAKYGATEAAKVQAIPFAFDTSFDQITYNSCAKSDLPAKSGFFTLMAGAYGNGGGVKIKQEFFDYADLNFKPIYPDVALSETQYKEYLYDSPANNQAKPLMALRKKNDLNSPYYGGSAAILGSDIVPMVGKLTDSLIMADMVQKGKVTSYFPFSAEQKIVEAKLSFNNSQSTAQLVRDKMMGEGFLTLAYTNSGAEVSAVRSPSTTSPVKTAYGKGYYLTFANAVAPLGGATLYATNPNNILSEVREVDLMTPTTGAVTWSCPATRRYMVVLAKDQAVACPREDITLLSNAAYLKELEIVRRHLKSSEWDVNISKRCVVPKNGATCYEEIAVSGVYQGVQYDRSKECNLPYRDQSTYADTDGDGTPNIPTKVCAEFVSICTKSY